MRSRVERYTTPVTADLCFPGLLYLKIQVGKMMGPHRGWGASPLAVTINDFGNAWHGARRMGADRKRAQGVFSGNSLGC